MAVPAAAQSPAPYVSPPGFEEAVASEMYEEAETIAKSEIARMLSAEQGDAVASAFLYCDLAKVQRLSGNIPAASLNYSVAVELIETNSDRMNVALERPLQGLGMTALDSHRPDLALEFFNRAIHVRQVNDGPHAIAQAGSIEMLARAHADAGDTDRASAMADRLGLLIQRHRSDPSVDVVALRLNQGALYRALGERVAERESYSAAISMVQEREDLAKSLLVEPYTRIGESYLFEYFEAYAAATSKEELPDMQLLDEREKNLRAANELANSLEVSDWMLRHRALLALGDFYTLSGNFSEARQNYTELWALLTVEPSRLEWRKRDLEAVTPLWQPSPRIQGMRIELLPDSGNGSAQFDGEVDISFTVNQRGRLTNIALVDNNAERKPQLEAKLKEGLGSFVYRPRLMRGFLVDTPDLRISFGFTDSLAGPENE